MRDRKTLDEFTLAYMVCALWSTNDESDERGGEPLDKNYDIEDLADETWDRMVEDCRKFQEEWGDTIDCATVSRSSQYSKRGMAGHDFWLTRNGHGAGFWDGDWKPERHAKQLTKASEAFGEVWLLVGDDGKIHGH